MPAEMDHRGTGQSGQQPAVGAQEVADHAQLFARARQRTIVAAMGRRGALQRSSRGHLVSTQDGRLGFGGRGVVRIARLGRHELEHHARKLARPRAFPGDEPQRGRIDARVIALGTGEDRVVEARGVGREPLPRTPLGVERDVFGDPGSERADVLVGARAQPVFRESPGRFLSRPGSRQREHRAMLEAQIARMLIQPALGEVERRQELTPSLLRAHGVQPPRRAFTLLRIGRVRGGQMCHGWCDSMG